MAQCISKEKEICIITVTAVYVEETMIAGRPVYTHIKTFKSLSLVKELQVSVIVHSTIVSICQMWYYLQRSNVLVSMHLPAVTN